jgi:hypothetical protein
MKRMLPAALAAAFLAHPAPACAAASSSDDAPVVIVPRLHIAAADGPDAGEAWKRWAEDFSREMRASMGTMFAGRMGAVKTVKGAPYSAEVITETRQTLADGNVISKKTTGHVYRDGEGRTRQESGAPGKDMSVFISDPVEGRHIVINPGSKTAVVAPLADSGRAGASEKRVVKIDGSEVRVENGKVFMNGHEVADGPVNVKSKSGKSIRVENGRVTVDGKEVAGADRSRGRVVVTTVDSGDGTQREEVRVQVVRAGDDVLVPVPPAPPLPPPPMAPGAFTAPLAPLPPMPGLQTMRFESTARLGKGVTTGLGTKEFDGVRAEGKSTVWTIPAGEIGNRDPIRVTSESWYAPELQVTVYSRHSDPRTGESIYRLAGIRRVEPAFALFRAPEGYTVKDRVREREDRERARQERERARGERARTPQTRLNDRL